MLKRVPECVMINYIRTLSNNQKFLQLILMSNPHPTYTEILK